MKRDQYYRETADAGGGATRVPFHDVFAPALYIGEVISTVLTYGFTSIGHAATAFNRWRWERATVRALESLDNATLADIGVSRSEIPAVAKASAENPTFTPARRSKWTV